MHCCIRLFTLLTLFHFGSCSLQKTVLRKTTPFFSRSSQLMMEENDWDYFKESAPAQLKLMELVYQQNVQNKELLALLVRNFSGYAFIVFETLLIDDELKGMSESVWKNRALSFYTKAFDYGLEYLEKNGVLREDLLSHDLSQIKKSLSSLSIEHVTGILYTAQAWASLINLQQDNIFLVSQLPVVKTLFDKACTFNPVIDGNVCDLFFARYELSRPPALGGDPQRGEKILVDAIKKNPQNLLLQEEYIRQVIVPSMNIHFFDEKIAELSEKLENFYNLKRNKLINESSFKKVKNLHLFNATAKKRMEILKKYREDIFF